VLSVSRRPSLDRLDAYFSLEYAFRMSRETRGLRFSFDATAEIAAASSPKSMLPGRVTELSLQGCFVETSASFELKRHLLLKIHDAGESFETEAVVLYHRPSGIGLVFRDVKPRHRDVLQNWILKALDRQLEAQQILG
jgi:hypothetical protein